MKKFGLKSLAIAICLLFSIDASAYDFSVDGMYFNIVSLEDLTCKITYGDEKYTGDFVIPEQVSFNGRILTVIEVGNSAFSYSINMNSISIPNSVTTIGDRAFSNCTGLTSVNLPNSVTTIGDGAFSNCTGLKNIELPTSITTVGNRMFDGCISLMCVGIPNSVTTIGDRAFEDCVSMTNISLAAVITIGDYAFSGCSALANVTMPNSILMVGNYAFLNCSSLTEITLPSSLENIGSGAFSGCRGLKNVVIEDAARELGCSINSTFHSSPIENFYIGRTVSWDDIDITLAFKTTLNKVTIGSLVEKLCGDFFKNIKIKHLILEDGNNPLSLYDDYGSFGSHIPFYGCKFESLYLGRELSDSELSGFKGAMKTLKDVTIGFYVSSFDDMFKSSEELSTIKLTSATPPTINSDCFVNKQYINVNIEVPTGSLSAYQSAEGWKNFWNMTESEELLKCFEVDGLRYAIDSDTEASVIKKNNEHYEGEIIVPSKVSFATKEYAVVGINDAFNSSPNLSKVILPSSLVLLEPFAFKDDTELQQVVLPENLEIIPVSCFENCPNLKDFALPQSIIKIEDNAFNGCKALSSIEFGDNLKSIGASAFEGCSSLEELSIPASAFSFGEDAFDGCSGLKELMFEDGSSPLVFPNSGNYVSQTDLEKKTVDGKTIRYRIRYYYGYFNGLPINKLYIGRNLSDEVRYTISGDGGVDEYVITSYDGPFCNFSHLSELTIGENVSILGPQKMHIPEIDMSVNPNSFSYCKSIELVKVEAAIPPTGAEFSTSVYENAVLVVPDESVEDYKVATGWKEFYNIVGETEYAGVNTVGTGTMKNVKIENGNIIVDNVKGFVNVYDIAGMLVKSIKADGSRVEIAMSQRGIYIVRTEENTVKVAIR